MPSFFCHRIPDRSNKQQDDQSQQQTTAAAGVLGDDKVSSSKQVIPNPQQQTPQIPTPTSTSSFLQQIFCSTINSNKYILPIIYTPIGLILFILRLTIILNYLLLVVLIPKSLKMKYLVVR